MTLEAKTASLYIHIPFCAGACDYCDFFSVPVSAAGGLVDKYADKYVDKYIDALLGDLECQLRHFAVERVPSVYIGGGTPSVLGAARMGRLLSGISSCLSGKGGLPDEFTVEANPESSDENFLAVCRDCGVNRVSVGLQSFYEPSRRAVRRLGRAEMLDERLALVSRWFPGGFSADLMSGLPFQTAGILAGDIERLLSFKPSHVSLYSLTVAEETPLGQRLQREGRAALSLPELDDADALYLAGRDMLEAAGYSQYEVSNFALPGKRSIHNTRYWRMENWLGIGAAASGTVIDDETGTGERYTCPPDIEAYIAAARPLPDLAVVENLSRAALVRESLLMGFRFRDGPDPYLFRRRFGMGIGECIPRTVERWRGRGFFEDAPRLPGGENALKPSAAGLLFVDAFLRDAFAELPPEEGTV